jgi:Uma2 family endonuclease
MSPLPEHERYGEILGQLILTLAMEAKQRIATFGSTTFRREDLQRALEPDKCFYLASFPRILGRRVLDLTRDPPPDLVLEVDVNHSSIDRMAIYASLGVPELWRMAGERLQCYGLASDGTYEEREFSLAFPLLRVNDLMPFVLQVFDTDVASLVQSFQNWLRSEVLSRPLRG